MLRDVESEKKIINFFEASEFVVDKDRLYLEDEEKYTNLLIMPSQTSGIVRGLLFR